MESKIIPECPGLNRSSVRTCNLAAAAAVLLFATVSLLADLRPVKTSRFHFAASYHHSIEFLLMDLDVRPEMRYNRGHGMDSASSLAYRLALRPVSWLFPGRILCLRMASILASGISLWLLYLFSRRFFGPPAGVVSLLLVLTSPLGVDSLRSLGYFPLTILANTALCYLLSVSLRSRHSFAPVAGMSLLAYASLSLAALGRMVLFLPFLIYGIYFRDHGWKLLVYVAILAALIVAVDSLSGDVRFRPGEFLAVGDEWMEPSGEDGSLAGRIALMAERARGNLRPLRDFLIGGIVYDAEDTPVRFISVVLAPFFFVAVWLCLKRRSPADLLLLSWFAITALPPLFSSDYTDHRLAQAFPPYFVLLALGAVRTYAFLRDRIGPSRRRRWLAAGCGALLALVLVFNLREFFLETARSRIPYSHEQLKRLVCHLSREAEAADRIWLRGQINDVIWGNPYFDRRCCDITFVQRMWKIPPARPDFLETRVASILREREKTLLVVSTLNLYPPGEFLQGDLDFIRRLEENPDHRISVTRLPGLDGVHFILINPFGPSESGERTG